MENDDNFFNTLLIELSYALYPLKYWENNQSIKTVFNELGYDLNNNGDLTEIFAVPSNITVNIIGIINDIVDETDESKLLDHIIELVGEIIKMITEIKKVVDNFAVTSGASNDFLNNAPIDELPERLINYLLIEYLKTYHPRLYGTLFLIGIIDVIPLEAIPNIFQPQVELRKIQWERVIKYFSKPGEVLEDLYQWQTNFDSDKFLGRLETLLRIFILPGGLYKQSATVKNALGNTSDELLELRIPLIQKVIAPDILTQFGLNFSPAEANSMHSKGIGIIPYLLGVTHFEFDLGEKWEIVFDSSASLDAGLGLIIRPPIQFQIIDNLFTSPGDSGSFGLEAGIKQKEASNDGLIKLLPEDFGSQITIDGIGFKVFGQKNADFEDVGGELNISSIEISIGASEGDGFLSSVLSGIDITANIGLGLGMSLNGGFYFKGSGALEIALPTHIELGPIEIINLTIGLMPKDGMIPVTVSTSIIANLGPLKAVVENIGLKADFSFPSNNSGNLGPLDLDLGFKPPNGVGLSIDSGAVKGGGYLFFDFDREEYAGALELVFSEWIALKAIGLITTKMPDGSKGFSMVIIISVEFGSGIQLGMGFTLMGVGGLLGINRTVRVEPLTEGIRTGSINNIMFPTDVVANAPKIISDLRAIFPAYEGQFLIGPMAKIGYGTPTLASLSLGVIIEFPDVTITILGVLKVALPTEDADVLRLQVNFIGRVEPANNLLWFYAELYDSRILFITLEGGMGLLVNWGDNSNFVFSIGGFHPQYTPPPLPFPSPPRLAVNILNESYARVRIEGYFAVTSNTVQFGARVEVFFGVDAFNIDGHFGFDALFQFDPFYFTFGLSVGLSVKLFGLGLFSIGFSGILEGPTPWHINGRGRIGFLFFSVSVPFEETWGEERHTELPPIEVFPIIEREFAAITNWEAIIPEASSLLVSLRKLGEQGDPPTEVNEQDTRPLVLHPVGALRISQRKLPLDIILDKIGSQRPSDVNKISVNATVGGTTLAVETIQDKFATGEFRDLNESQRLSSPGFDTYNSGMIIKPVGEQLKTSMAVKRVIRYETVIIDNNFKRHVFRFFQLIHTSFALVYATLFSHFLNGNSVSSSTLSNKYRNQISPNNQKITLEVNKYTVAFNDTNKPISVSATQFNNQASALDYMEEEIAKDPTKAAQIHIIPNTEINRAA